MLSKGYSLIEILIVLTILAIIASVAVPAFKRHTYSVRVNGIYEMLQPHVKDFITYQSTHGSFNFPDPWGYYLAAGDGYNGNWGMANGMYPNPTCPGSKGTYIVLAGTEYGNIVYAFWFANVNGVIKTQCAIVDALSPEYQQYSGIVPSTCEYAPGSNIWGTTPLVTALMAQATCD